MSSADAPPQAARCRGFSLLEVTIAVAFLGLMALVFERSLLSAQRAEQTMSSIGRAKQRAEKVLYEVYRDVSGARRIFGRGGDLDASYLDQMDLSRLPPSADVRLPAIGESGVLAPDAPGDESTGNAIAFALESDPVVCALKPSEGEAKYIDVYRFTCVYPHETDAPLVAGDERPARDLVHWTSVPYPSYAQLEGLADAAEQQTILKRLLKTYGFRYAWDVNAPAHEAFYEILASGALASAPTSDHEIAEDLSVARGGCLRYAEAQLARTEPGHRLRGPRLTANETGGWVPHGFEVKVVGPSGNRKVFLHLVVETRSVLGEGVAHASTLIASVRDL